ncbi:MAG: hypothetical protein NZ954_08785 [Thermofilaceae archaeon]|nr:hypothetical protein [Thermofilaceae archaeon]MDW8005067.1 hypothetical protein [Thermofilaceae archaeon]
MVHPNRWQALTFQFFPSCCERKTKTSYLAVDSAFQFFPSCCGWGNPPRILCMENCSFNSFPVAVKRENRENRGKTLYTLSILSQLLFERTHLHPSK